jgi:pyruvate carboxylase
MGRSDVQEINIELEKGKTLFIKLKHISPTNELGTKVRWPLSLLSALPQFSRYVYFFNVSSFQDVTFDLNGSTRIIKIRDNKAGECHNLC